MVDLKKNFINVLDERINNEELLSCEEKNLDEALSILKGYSKTSHQGYNFISCIEDFKVSKYTNNLEVISGKISYNQKYVDYLPNNFTIVKKNNYTLYAINRSYQEKITKYKVNKETDIIHSNKNATFQKENIQFWLENFHVFNFTSFFEQKYSSLVAEVYQRGFSLTDSKNIMTGLPLHGFVVLRHASDQCPIEINYENGNKIYNAPQDVEKDIKRELNKVLEKSNFKKLI